MLAQIQNLPEIISIRGNSAVIYKENVFAHRGYSTKKIPINFQNVKTYSGEVTASVSKRIRKAVHCLVQCSKKRTIYNTVTLSHQNFKLAFLTLTIPDKTSLEASHYYKILLKPFLRILRERFGCSDYIWKAELQQRGSIHYHLTINQFIPHTTLRDIWNGLLVKADLMREYSRKYKSINPNSIDIHSVRGIENLEGYLVKYISKVEKDDRKLKGKVWGCSESLQSAKYHEAYVSDRIHEAICKAKESGKIVVKAFERCVIVRLKKNFTWYQLDYGLNNSLVSWIDSALGNSALVHSG